MNKKVKEAGRKGKNISPNAYSSSFKRKVALHYINGDQSHRQVAAIYGVHPSVIGRWSKQFYPELVVDTKPEVMTEEEKKELQALKAQNDALKKKLDYEQMRNYALETMIDLAKEQMGVDVRKNFGAKQPEE
jgi:transposase